VSTALPYYARFLERFPDVAALAAAPLDDVLAAWSGLGYYSRARNLHRCAQAVVGLHGGQFPRTAQSLETLPGIGRSTAAAVASFCWGERVAILDGNVKRVLSRFLAFGEDLAQARAERALWAQASALLPAGEGDMPAYTQGVMDLGATICLPRTPNCLLCPVESSCAGRREGAPERFPIKSRKLKRSAQSLWLLRVHDEHGAVWLEKRPTPGVWAGLYCLPVFDSRDALEAALAPSVRSRLRDADAFVHVLTHKDLHLHPVSASLSCEAMNRTGGAWFGAADWPALGLPAPVRKLLGAGL